MKILLDESTPQKLRLLIGAQHTVMTAFQGWSELKNGELLEAAEAAGFELFITADQDLSYQQNLTGRRIAVLVLSTNNWNMVRERVGIINAAIEPAIPGTFVFVDLGRPDG
jgi:predicted nuclease of predicted toxin-antitoxin system